mgnify:CR=1 FL=1
MWCTNKFECFLRHVTEQMGDVETVSRLFVPQSFCSLGCPQLLQTVAPSELMEVKGRMVHVVTVRPWNDGNQDDEEIMLQLPAQLTQKDKVMLVNTLGVFYGILMFVKEALDMTYHQIKSLKGETDSDTGDVELQPSSHSLLTQDQLRTRFRFNIHIFDLCKIN